MEYGVKKFYNEWMTELMEKIDSNDKDTSVVSAYMYGLMQCPWERIEETSLSYENHRIEDTDGVYKDVLKPRVYIKFYKK